jgi:hypothetical protein
MGESTTVGATGELTGTRSKVDRSRNEGKNGEVQLLRLLDRHRTNARGWELLTDGVRKVLAVMAADARQHLQQNANGAKVAAAAFLNHPSFLARSQQSSRRF